MTTSTAKTARRRRRPSLLQIRVSEAELSAIIASASACGLNRTEYLRRIGMGYAPASKLDQVAMRDLCKIIGDIGRLGGLLKLWMSLKRNSHAEVQDGISIRSIDALWRDLQGCIRLLRERIVKL